MHLNGVKETLIALTTATAFNLNAQAQEIPPVSSEKTSINNIVIFCTADNDLAFKNTWIKAAKTPEVQIIVAGTDVGIIKEDSEFCRPKTDPIEAILLNEEDIEVSIAPQDTQSYSF